MRRQYVGVLARAVLVGSLCSLAQCARAVEPGTYGFEINSKQESMKIELRCVYLQSLTVACEVDGSKVLDGLVQPADIPRIAGMEPLGGCLTAPHSQWDECDVGQWVDLQRALDYARGHVSNQPNPAARALLAPLVASKVNLVKCDGMEDGVGVVVCDLARSPWKKAAKLYFAQLMAPCSAARPFCEYAVWPLFKTSDSAQLRGIGGAPHATPPAIVPSAQAAVSSYIELLESRVRQHLTVPAGTPPSARVTYQVQFRQDSGVISYIQLTGGCYCPQFRSAVNAAVQSSGPLPLLPSQQQSIIGNRTGRVDLQTSAAAR